MESTKFINYTIIIRNQGTIVPRIGDNESIYGDFDINQLEHINFCLNILRENNLKSRNQFSHFGKLLFDALLKPVQVSFLGQVYQELVESETTQLRIRIVFEETKEPTALANQIINLPWEFLCNPHDDNTFLATHPRIALSYGYQTWLNNPLEGYATQEFPLRVLFVHAHPSSLPDVGFTDFVQDILTKIGEAVKVEKLENPTPTELSNALSKQPHVLHFLGHGKPGALALGDQPNGETSWLEDKSLSDFLGKGGVKLVVLQACEGASPLEESAFTGTVAELVKAHIPAVIAMRYPILQPLAWNFVKTLYQKIAAGDPVDMAVQSGQAKYLSELGEKNLIDAICRPAKRQGYEVTEELLEEILKEIKQEDGFLPLLEFALTQVWQKRDEENHQLTRKTYEEIEKIKGALNRHAQKVYNYRDYKKDSPEENRQEEEQALIKKIFLKLLQIGEGEKDTRSRQPKKVILSLAGDNQEGQKILTALVEGRLLVTGGEDPWVDIVHEALIEGWEELNQWRNEK